MSTSTTTDYGDYTETIEGEPTWDNPTVWKSIRRDYKAGTAEANGATLQAQAQTAMAGNRDYLAIASPTTAQMRSQLAALTRQTQALIRLQLVDLDGTD